MPKKKKKKLTTPEEVAAAARKNTVQARTSSANSYKKRTKNTYSKKQYNKDKSTHTSIIEKQIPSDADRFLMDDMYMQQMMPMTDAVKQKVADRLVEWVTKNPDACVFARFLEKERLAWSTYMRWKDSHEGLASAHEYALTALGARREEKYITPQFVSQTMSVYNPLYKEHDVWKSQLRAQEAKASASPTKIIVQDMALSGDGE